MNCWRQRHGHELLGYLTALGEFETLMAIAAYAYENPGNPFPELANEGPVLESVRWPPANRRANLRGE